MQTYIPTGLKLLSLVAVLVSLTACGNPYGVYYQVSEYFSARTTEPNPWPPSRKIRAIHANAPFIADLHADTLLHPDDGLGDNYRLLVNAKRDGHVDINRLIEGNVALQVFSVVSKGSLDILGDTLPFITGTYTDEAGVQGTSGAEYSRYNFIRDPNVAQYDDPNAPYVETYDAISTTRDLGAYFYRMADMPCTTWYDGGNWSLDWGYTAPCSTYDPDREYNLRLLESADRLHRAAAVDDRVKIIRTQHDLDNLIQQRNAGVEMVGTMLSTEGLYFRSSVSTPQGKAELQADFNELYDAGYRMFGFTHFIDNDHGGSSTGMGRALHVHGKDLSSEGMYFAELAVQNNTILDLAHASAATFTSMVSLARSHGVPVVVSHTGLSQIPGTDELCQQSRNLSNSQVLEVVSTGGLVGIGFADAFVCDNKPIAWAKGIRHAVDTIDAARIRQYEIPSSNCGAITSSACRQLVKGIDHVALGSDYDGGIEAYTDVDDLNQYTEALVCKKTWWKKDCLDNPFTPEEAYKILGGNSLAVMRKILPNSI